MLAAFAENTHNVSRKHAEKAIADSELGTQRSYRKPILAVAALLLLAAIGTGVTMLPMARLQGAVAYLVSGDAPATGLVVAQTSSAESVVEASSVVAVAEAAAVQTAVVEETPMETAQPVLEEATPALTPVVETEVSTVELFDREKYNTNMSVAENLLFGTPTDTTFDLDNLSANAYVRKVLHEEDLMGDFIDTGHKLAEIMADLFADVEPGSEQFSYISAEDLPDFRALLARTEAGSYDNLDVEDRNKLMAVPFRLVVARHRLGLIDEVMRQRLLGARRAFEQGFGEGSPAVEFFDRDRFNPQISIQDNILFGRLAYGRARGAVEIGNLIREVVEKLDLRRIVMEVGLEYQVGIAGARLNAAQRQKLSIARCLLKRPQVMIMDQATAALDDASRATIEENLVSVQEAGLIWVEGRASLEFDYQIVLESGKVVYQGPPQPS